MIPDYVYRDNFELQRTMQALVPHLYNAHKFGMPCGSARPEESVLLYKYENSIKRLARLKQELFETSGKVFNTGAWQHVQSFVYDHLKLDKKPVVEHLRTRKKKGKKKKLDKDGNPEANADKYALCLLHYLNKSDAHIDKIFNLLIEVRKLDKTISSQYAKLLLVDECQSCKKKSDYYTCRECGGTTYGKFRDFDPNFCSERDGWLFVHSTHLQNQVTLRIGASDPPLTTFPRANHTKKLYPREIFVAPPGYTFVFTDLAKAERRFCAVYYDDHVMLDEVERGHAAVAEFGQELFGYTAEQVAKGTDGYSNTKTTLYLTQLGGGGKALHETLIGNYMYVPVDECWNIIGKVIRKYPYQQKIFGIAWEALVQGWWQTYFKQRFIYKRPHDLDGFNSIGQIKNAAERGYEKPMGAFEAFVRIYAATNIQGSATGIGTQIAALRYSEMLKANPRYKDVHLCLLKHDEMISVCPIELADEIKEMQEFCLTKKFETPQPYLSGVLRPELFFDMQAETEICRQWDVSPHKKYEGEYRNGILYRA